jgi:modulator of FtsH protease HflK
MSDEHNHTHDDAGLPPAPPAHSGPDLPEDAGSQALAEALRSSFWIVRLVMAGLVLVFLFSGFFTVGPQQKAIILHFGKPRGAGKDVLLGSGLHWSFPPPIDEVVKIPFTGVQTVSSSVGWYFTLPGGQESQPGPSLNPARDGYAVTGDGNIIHTRAILSYRIEEPIRYEFDFVNASNATQNALDNALLYAASHFAVDDALSKGIAAFREAVQRRVTELAQKQGLGIVIEQCNVESIPPRQLKVWFDAVNTAQTQQDATNSAAMKWTNYVLSKAVADSATITNTALADKLRFVSAIQSDADNFTNYLAKYRENPGLFANILLLQKIGDVMPNVQDKYYVPERPDGKSRELRLQLNREPLKSTNATPQLAPIIE